MAPDPAPIPAILAVKAVAELMNQFPLYRSTRLGGADSAMDSPAVVKPGGIFDAENLVPADSGYAPNKVGPSFATMRQPARVFAWTATCWLFLSFLSWEVNSQFDTNCSLAATALAKHGCLIIHESGPGVMMHSAQY